MTETHIKGSMVEHRRNKQIADNDCLRACITSLLDLPNDPSLPNVGDPDWELQWDRILRRFGLTFSYRKTDFWRGGYWIASVESKNYPLTSHAIIMHGTKVEFDPSPLKRYSKGTNLLGEDVIYGGFLIEVIDITKIGNLDKFRRELES